MNDENKLCPKCGTAIPDGSPHGLCPKCLMAAVAATNDTGSPSSVRPPPPTREEVAAAFPQLEVIELIGQGGMGAVFKARQPKLDRVVALKILARARSESAAFAERFTREGRLLARLNHPGIVAVHDFGQADGFFYLLMEYVDGVNLRQAMRAGRFTPEEALAVTPKICEALQFAHNEGVLHRDIKPENILLDSKGRVKIADFGIAKLIGERAGAAGITESGSQLGTPHYMAPEQVEKPAEVDHRADIYSLGVVFYEMLTGELPIGRFAPPSEKSTVDPRLDEVVFRTLEKEPGRRQQSADELRTQVQAIAGQPKPAPGAGDGAESSSQKWMIFQILGFAGAALLTILCWIFKTADTLDAPLFGTALIVGAVLFYSLGLPLWLRMMPMNSIYGVRFREAFESEKRWHEVNAYAGLRIIRWSSLVAGLGAAGFFLLPGKTYAFHAALMLIGVVIVLLIDVKIWAARTRGVPPGPFFGRVLGGVKIFAVATAIAFFVRTFVAQPYVLKGDALAPELPSGSRCVVWKLARPVVGDIVIYERHGSSLGVDEQKVRVMDLERRIQLVSKLAPEYLKDILPTLDLPENPTVSRTLPLLRDTLATEAWLRSVGVGEDHPRMKSLQAQKKTYSTMLADQLEGLKQAQGNQLLFEKDKLKALKARLEELGKFETGRVVAVQGRQLIVSRNNTPPFPIALEDVVGRIFLSTRSQKAEDAPKPAAARVLKIFTPDDVLGMMKPWRTPRF